MSRADAAPVAIWLEPETAATPLAVALLAGRPAPLRLGVPAAYPSAPAAAADAFEPLRAWLQGRAGRPAVLRPPRRQGATRSATLAAPRGTVLIVPGLTPWEGVLPALLARRSDVRALAVIAAPTAWDWPDFEPPARVASTARATLALVGSARMLVLPDQAAADSAAGRIGASARSCAIAIEAVPSGLAGTAPEDPDPALAGVPYVVAVGPIEARSNALLLLQIWRDGLARRLDLPKLVLAGERGPQVEEIAPLLDWNESLRPVVVEAPGLAPAALRRLISNARAVLAPDMARPPAPLLRDALALGVPVIAAETPEVRALGLTDLLSPLDGPGWRAAVLATAARPPAGVVPTALLPDWPDYAARLRARAATLA